MGLEIAYQANGGDNELRQYVKRHAALTLVPIPEVAQTLRLLLAQRPVLADDDMQRLQQFDEYVKIDLRSF